MDRPAIDDAISLSAARSDDGSLARPRARRQHRDELAAEQRVIGLHGAADADVRHGDADAVGLRLLDHPADRVAAVARRRERGELLRRRLAAEGLVEDGARAQIRRERERALTAEQVRSRSRNPVFVARCAGRFRLWSRDRA